MAKRNREVEKALQKKFKEGYKVLHDERVTENDYWGRQTNEAFEEGKANPDRFYATDTPWMNGTYLKHQEELEVLRVALGKVKLRRKARMVLDLFLAGYKQETIQAITGVDQRNISRQIENIGKKLKKLM